MRAVDSRRFDSDVQSPTRAETLTPEVLLRGITVTFGTLKALDDVDLHLLPGSRHAVVGENGAGKSTLMKVLFGLLAPDDGDILIAGKPRGLASPAGAIALGIGMVHQHFELIPSFTAAENVVLGSEMITRGALLDRAGAEEAVARLGEASGLSVDPRTRVENLSIAAQQRIEILKALYRNARVLILDEPTAVLAPSEARDLWAATKRLSSTGTTVVFITHKLDEVMAHADSVTVLRRGRRILSAPTTQTQPEVLAEAMIGTTKSPTSLQPPPASPVSWENSNRNPAQTAAAPTGIRGGAEGRLLTIRNLTVRGRRGEMAAADVSLDLFGGEIVGLAGVDGSGQVELIEGLFGLRAVEKGGSITLAGEDITALTTAQRRAAGVAYVPEDRHHRALVLPFSCEENIVLGRHRESAFAGRGGILKRASMRSFLDEQAAAFDVRGAAGGVPVSALSGGNQQKLVLARELSRRPRVLLASQPTRGLDFAASAFVHDALRAERDRGVAVLMQSLDLAEVLALSDRVAVMFQGRIAAVLTRDEATEAQVGELMTGSNRRDSTPRSQPAEPAAA